VKEIEYFFKWMTPSEVAEDFGITEKEALRHAKERNMRTQTTRHGEFQIFGEDLKSWYDELQQSSSESQRPTPKAQRPYKSRWRNPSDPALLPQHERTKSNNQWGEKPIPISIEEAANRLGVTERYTRRLIKEGYFATQYRGDQKLPILQSIELYLSLRKQQRDTRKHLREHSRMRQSDDTPLPDPWLTDQPESQSPTPNAQRPDSWVSTEKAAKTLQLTPARICQLAWEGKLESRQRVKRAPRQISWNAVLALLDQKETKQQARAIPAKEWLSDNRRPYIRTKIQPPPNDHLITRKEAANILNVHPVRISDLVKAGFLFGWQKSLGKQGSPLYLSQTQVLRLANNPTHQQSRATWDNSQLSTLNSQLKSWEEKGLTPRRFTDQSAYTERDHGDYYTTRQVALLLGCSPQCVANLRERRRLTGYRRPLKKNRYERRRWWFYKKEEVHNLLNDPDYLKHRNKYRRAQTPEAAAKRRAKLLEEPEYVPHDPANARFLPLHFRIRDGYFEPK